MACVDDGACLSNSLRRFGKTTSVLGSHDSTSEDRHHASTTEIRRGATNRRNPTLSGHAVKLLPTGGLGSGIASALDAWPAVEVIDDVAANQFRIVISRAPVAVTPPVTPPVIGRLTPPVTSKVTPQVTLQVTALLSPLQGELSKSELLGRTHLRDRMHYSAF